MILAVLGGSAHSTPVLADALKRGATQPVTLRLAGRRRNRLDAVVRASRILCAGSLIDVEGYAFDDWPAAIAGSDVVLIQTRVGGYESRAFDERFPIEHGVPGDEGLGPSGISAAYRGWPQLAEWLRHIHHNAPASRVILLSSPGSLLVHLTAAVFPGLDAAHVCELPFTTLQQFAAYSGEVYRDLTFDYVGVNHLGWLYNVRARDKDLVAAYAASVSTKAFPSPALVAELCAFPLSYLRLHYETQQVIAEQRAKPSRRAEELMAIAANSFRAFENGDETAIRNALSARRVDWYDTAVVPLMRAWLGEHLEDTSLFLTTTDRAPSIAERRYEVVDGFVQEVRPARAAPSSLQQSLVRFKTFERNAAEAVLDGSPEALADAIATHPWVGNNANPGKMAQQIIAHARPYRAFETNVPCLS